MTQIRTLSLTMIEEMQSYPLSIRGLILYLSPNLKREGLRGRQHRNKTLQWSLQHRQANRATQHTQCLRWFRVSRSDKHVRPGSAEASVLLTRAGRPSGPLRKGFSGGGVLEDVAYAPSWPHDSTGTAADSLRSSSLCHVDTLYFALRPDYQLLQYISER